MLKIFNLCCMSWVKNYPCIHWKIQNSLFFLATAITFYDFKNISFLLMLTRNQVCWWNNNFEKLPQSQHHESFTMLKVKVMGEFSPTVCMVWKFLFKGMGFYPQRKGRKSFCDVWRRWIVFSTVTKLVTSLKRLENPADPFIHSTLSFLFLLQYNWWIYFFGNICTHAKNISF